MNKLTATAGTLAALNESTGTVDVVLAWENTDGVTTFSSIPRTQLTQIITQHEAQRQAGQEPAWRDALEDAILALENSGWTRSRDASLTTLRQTLAAPQPAAHLDKDAEIAQLQDLNDSADKALARQDAEIAALRQDAERYRWLNLQDLTYLSLSYIVDREHDGEYCVDTLDDVFYGATLGAAIDAAMAQAVQPRPLTADEHSVMQAAIADGLEVVHGGQAVQPS